MEFYTINNGRITEHGRPVHLRGVNLGGWLMPEAYLMFAPSRGYRFFRAGFVKALGEKSCLDLERAFRDNFITESDLELIAGLGFDHVRLPFHYGLIETAPYTYSKDGLKYLENAVAWGKKHGVRTILDMHAVPGAQNHDWHSDSDGRMRFYSSKPYQKRAAALWRFIAERFKDEPAVIGYDLLNETVVDDPALMNAYYHAAIKAIRAVDQKHLIFAEGNLWARDIACLDNFEDDNLVLGIHFYEPLEFVFNYIPGLSYPLRGGEITWDKAFMRQRLQTSVEISRQRGRALWCGEFGVNARDGKYGEDGWVRDILANFKALDIHWSYWTWKAIKNHMFPDGIYSYIPNDPWINRPGPVSGWDTWAGQWPTHKDKMIASWRTERFTRNESIAKVLWKK